MSAVADFDHACFILTVIRLNLSYYNPRKEGGPIPSMAISKCQWSTLARGA
jgi:hypothetical protein